MTRTRPEYRTGYRIARRQTGAALVVGLLLLLVLTVLAVSGVNTSSLNLMMAGNEQYSQDAFQAAETGIERALAANEFNPDANLPPERQAGVRIGTGGEYTAVSTLQLPGPPQLALPGASLRSFGTYHFEIDSTGKSMRRDAVTRNVQAIAVIVPLGAEAGPGAGLGTRLN